MIFTFFTIITFIGEVIIAIALIRKIRQLDNSVIVFDRALSDSRKSITEISELSTKISEQILELAKEFTEKIKKEQENFVIGQLNKLLIAFILYRINIKPIKKFRKSKLGKSLAKGFSMLQSMV